MQLALKIAIFAISMSLCAYEIFSGFDLVKDIYKATGLCALILFFASAALNFAPARFLWLVKFLGRLTAFYGVLHLVNFLAIDAQFAPKVLLKNISAISNIIGAAALFIMFCLLAKRCFALINTALFCCALHYALSVKVPEFSHYLAIAAAFLFMIAQSKKTLA